MHFVNSSLSQNSINVCISLLQSMKNIKDNTVWLAELLDKYLAYLSVECCVKWRTKEDVVGFKKNKQKKRSTADKQYLKVMF